MKIISISGLDGSGKSTQIKLLQDYLESKGKKVFYFHAVQFSIANILQKPRGVELPLGSSTPTPSVIHASWLKIQLRKVALIIDLFRFKTFIKNLKNQGYDYILSDRYFYDSIINIAYLSLPKVQHSEFRRLNLLTIPRPDFAFYLKTNPEDIMKRDRPADQGLEYLESKKKLYDKFSEKFELTLIDGNRNKEEIFNDIKSQILISNIK